MNLSELMKYHQAMAQTPSSASTQAFHREAVTLLKGFFIPDGLTDEQFIASLSMPQVLTMPGIGKRT